MDRELSRYVKDKKAFFGWITRKVREKTLEMISDNGRILDVGCGNGLFMSILGTRGFRVKELYGVDLSEDLLLEAKTIFKAQGQEGVNLVKGNFFQLPFLSGTFQSIVCLNTTVNIIEDESVDTLLMELKRVSTPSGRIYIDIRNSENPVMRLRYARDLRRGSVFVRGYSLRDFEERLKGTDLRIARYRPIGMGGRLLTFAYLLELTGD